ncbi:hypothetical protein ACFQMJ_35130, partial [Cohnella cellulosilytica]
DPAIWNRREYLRMKVDRTFCNGRYAYVPPGQFDIEIIPRLAAVRGRKSTVAMTMPFPQLIDGFWEAATQAHSGNHPL